ncbi:SAM-dependent methyltransferase [Streptomyces sp. N2-109]|uniref:SAM-dependent methyltransferase n=1 Tax=Streptomyces gossypii TaxID=2883101 RepID=A0ABT2JKT6_9ACTN|nr:SAM-dependent methyltransferase [Streptomyces gossypii]MCT2588492.1 SAM-dependent methyltransferase [Streptomyces gossypii]
MGDAPDWMRHGNRPSVELHTDRAHAARVYDVLLGGKTNYPADREAAAELLKSLPNAAMVARQNRAFMHRAVRFLAAEAGIRQFLDIGTGIPTSPNLHEIAQEAAAHARVIYVDNDPIVLVHSRALHHSSPEGRTAYIPGDLCEPEHILGDAQLLGTFDRSRPVAVTLLAVLHWLPEGADPYDIVDRILRELPAGSWLALTHVTDDFAPQAMRQATEGLRAGGSNVKTRSEREVLRFFDGLELADPGLCVVQRWRPDPVDLGTRALGPADIPLYAGVARKP